MLKVPQDKQMHFLTGALLFAMLNVFLFEPFCLVIVVVVGLAKEVYDHFNRDKHCVEALDAISTALGGLFMWVLVYGRSVFGGTFA